MLVTPYLFLYDMMVLAIPVAMRLGLSRGFLSFELPVLALVVALILSFIVSGVPVGLAADLIVAALVLRRAGRWWRREPAAVFAPASVLSPPH